MIILNGLRIEMDPSSLIDIVRASKNLRLQSHQGNARACLTGSCILPIHSMIFCIDFTIKCRRMYLRPSIFQNCPQSQCAEFVSATLMTVTLHGSVTS